MEVEEKTLPAIDNSDESNSKKGKILTLLFPAESQPAEGKENRKDKNKPQTKVVIRRLPPRFTKEAFIEEFSPLPAHDYFHFVRGDLNLGTHAYSRAYINFLNQKDIFSFKEKFDDYDLQDDKGRTYHAVVEFAPFQKIPKRNVLKKKLSKAGTLESDPKYIEFLQKLEESKNFINNPSEYFHETENSALKAKVITTPLLEFLKKKRQKKIDLRNEMRQRKREAEREKRRKEEEKRKAERERRKEEKKNFEKSKLAESEKGDKAEERVREKKTGDDRGRMKDEKKETKNRKNLENDAISEERLETVIPNDPAILEVVVRRSEKEGKSGVKAVTKGGEEVQSSKSSESDANVGKCERKYSDFRNRVVEEKHRKSFYKRDSDDSKMVKTSSGGRKGVPDEKGDNCSIGNCGEATTTTSTAAAAKRSAEMTTESEGRRHDYNKVEMKETKSKFRYSEQRNRDREYRQTKSDGKSAKETCHVAGGPGKESSESRGPGPRGSHRNEGNNDDDDTGDTVKRSSSEPRVADGGSKNTGTGTGTGTGSPADGDSSSRPGRRKSLEMERSTVDTDRKRSKSFHDVSGKEFSGFGGGKKDKCNSDTSRDLNTPDKDSVQTDDTSKESTESDKMDDESKKDPRAERRIRNKRMHPCDCHPTCTYAKDRPSIEIYRPGMGKFSKQRLEQKKEDHPSSPTGTSSPFGNKSNRFSYGKSGGKKAYAEGGGTKGTTFIRGGDDSGQRNAEGPKGQSEVRTMTFTRSASKEN